MTLSDLLEKLLRKEPGLTVDELWDRLGRDQAKVRGREYVLTALTAKPDRFVTDANGRWSSKGFEAPAEPEDSPKPGEASVADWRALEHDLRNRLRGRRIVFELGLNARVYLNVADAFDSLLATGVAPEDAARRAPALVVTYLVGHGTYRYHGGTFWEDFTNHKVDGSFGPAFEKAIETLALESFDDIKAENAFRYVGPILAHGGIPKYCLDDYFELVGSAMRQGARDSTSMMAHWRTRKSAFQGVDRPVRRFLLHGGDLAADFLDRSVEMIDAWAANNVILAPDEAALPAYLLTSFRDLAGTAITRDAVRQKRKSAGGVRPRFLCDPFDPQGPSITLPTVAAEHADGFWLLSSEHGLQRVRAGRLREQSVPVVPARAWSVELRARDEAVAEETFEGLDSIPVLLFDPRDSSLIPIGGGIRTPTVVVLRPGDKTITAVRSDGTTGEARRVATLPEPTGAWTGYVLESLDLTGVRSLEIADPTGTATRRIAVRSVERPELAGRRLEAATIDTGEPVIVGEPGLMLPDTGVDWSVRVAAGGETEVFTSAGGTVVDLIDHLPVGHPSLVTVAVRGTLGSDLRERFAWVPGLGVQRPSTLELPGQPVAPVVISSELLAIDGQKAPLSAERRPGEGSDRIEVDVGPDGESMAVGIQVARVLWGSIRPGSTDMGTEELRLPSINVVDGVATGLMVTTGTADIAVMLELSRSGQVVQQSAPGRTVGVRGAWIFDLQRFVDTVRVADEPLEMRLRVGSAQVPVRLGAIIPTLDIEDLTVDAAVVDGGLMLDVDFRQARTTRSRVLRLWPMARMWDRPVTVALDDDAQPPISLLVEPAPPLGPYLAEVTVEDGWTTPQRPAAAAGRAPVVNLGRPEETQEDFLRRSDSNPSVLVEWAAVTGRRLREFTRDEAQDGAREALWATAVRLRNRDRWSDNHKALLDLLRVGREALPEAASSLLEEQEVTATDLEHVALQLAPGFTARHREYPSESALRTTWQGGLALGFLLEAGPLGERGSDRFEEFLGWSPEVDLDTLPLGVPVTQHWLGMAAEQLEGIRGHLQFDVSPPALNQDGLIAAMFQWLEAAKSNRPNPVVEWFERHRKAFNGGYQDSHRIREHLQARATAGGRRLHGAAFPRVVLLAGLHLHQDTSRAGTAAVALSAAAAFAPLQVRRDFVLAKLLCLDAQPDVPGDPDGSP